MRRGPEVAAFSGGTAGSSDVAGATVTFTFTGTAVSWIGLRCSICGIASVSIDGGAATLVDTAGPAAVGSPGLTSSAVFTASGLASGSHTLVITVTGRYQLGRRPHHRRCVRCNAVSAAFPRAPAAADTRRLPQVPTGL